MTLELCAGIVDKKLSLPEIAKEEVNNCISFKIHLVCQQTTEEMKLKANCQVLEECGYEVEASRLEHVVTCPASVGTGGTSQTIFSLEVHFFTAYHVKF